MGRPVGVQIPTGSSATKYSFGHIPMNRSRGRRDCIRTTGWGDCESPLLDHSPHSCDRRSPLFTISFYDPDADSMDPKSPDIPGNRQARHVVTGPHLSLISIFSASTLP